MRTWSSCGSRRCLRCAWALRRPSRPSSTSTELARHVYPNRVSNEGDDLLLALKYAEIVDASDHDLHDDAVHLHSPTTLPQWKEALTKVWNSHVKLKAKRAARKAAAAAAAAAYRGRATGPGTDAVAVLAVARPLSQPGRVQRPWARATEPAARARPARGTRRTASS